MEPDGIIDYSSVNKYVRSAIQSPDTSNNTNSNMDPIEKDIFVGLSITHTDTYSGSKSGGIVSLFNPRYPVVFVSWYGAAFYCNMLSEQRGQHLERAFYLKIPVGDKREPQQMAFYSHQSVTVYTILTGNF